MVMARPTGRDIRAEALDAASARMQSQGVRGFSYGDLAGDLAVRAPSIHHHFRRKDDLVAESARRYRERFRSLADAIDADRAIDRIVAYTDLFLSPAERGVLCLCGALAAGWDDLDDATRLEVDRFFADEIMWLGQEVRIARDEGDIVASIDPDRFAASYLSTLEGALLLGRTELGPQLATTTSMTMLALARVSPPV